MAERCRQLLPSSSQQEAASDGNRVIYLSDDNEVMHLFWESIARAQKRVWMTMYALLPDRVGQTTLDALMSAAARGCDVILIYDAVGSSPLKEPHLTPLREVGAHVVKFNPLWPGRRHGHITLRNHRKLLLVDDALAYCGGMNIGAPYTHAPLGTSKRKFDDAVLQLEGPCVHDLAAVFVSTLTEITPLSRSLVAPPPYPNGARVHVLPADPRQPETPWQQALEALIDKAHQRCFLTTPYFIPPPWLSTALSRAKQHGTDVRVLTAGQSDSVLARAAGRHCYGSLLRQGIRIYEKYGNTLHAKTLISDGVYSFVGSSNMDRWTSRHLLDLNVTVCNTSLASSLEDAFFEHLNTAKEVTLAAWQARSPLSRLTHRAAFQLACL